MPTIRLGPPPGRPDLREFPPVVEPAIRDIPGAGAPPSPAEPVTCERTAGPVGEELLGRVAPALAADERIRSALEGHRSVILGVSVRTDGKGRTAPTLVALVYDHTDRHTLEISLEDGAPPVITGVTTSAAQPGLSGAEIERATEIARAHPEVARRLTADCLPMVLLTSDVAEGDEHHGHRRAYVGFGPADRRLPRVRVVVDLGEERVLDPGGGGDE